MSHNSAQAVKSLLKPYVRRILLKTHPDYFSHDAKKKKINQASFQLLQNVLSPQGRQSGSNVAGEDNSLKIEFYVKTTGHVASTRIEHRLPVAVPTSSLDMWTTTSSILTLCRKMGIPVMPSDIDAAQKMINALSKPNSVSADYRAQAAAPSLTQIFANELYNSAVTEHSAKTDKSKYKFQLESNQLLFFQPHMSSKLKESMQKTLQSALPTLQPSRWWRKIPLLCVEDEKKVNGIDVSGILVFTSKMTTEGMQKYLQDNIETKEKECQQDLNAEETTKA